MEIVQSWNHGENHIHHIVMYYFETTGKVAGTLLKDYPLAI